MLYLPHLSSCLQNEGDNKNSCLLEVLAELNVIIYVRFSDRYLAKISSQKKKSSYYSISHLAQASWGQERHSFSRPSYSAWHTWILNQYLFSPSPSSSTHVFSRQKFPGVNCISADRNSEVYPHSASVHLHLFSNTVSSPGEGPQVMVQIAASVDAGLAGLQARPIQNCVNLPRGGGCWALYHCLGYEAKAQKLCLQPWSRESGPQPRDSSSRPAHAYKGWKKMETATGDFPGGPAAKSPRSQCRGAWVQLLGRELDPTGGH